MNRTPSRARRGLVAAVMAIAVASVGFAGQASAASYPSPNGSSFASGTEGWSATGAACTLGGQTVPLICSVANEFTAAAGNPPGSLETRFDTLVNAVELFVGKSTWRSPSFQVAEAPKDSVVFTIDRQANVQALLDLGGHADYEATLVDDASGAVQHLTGRRLENSPGFVTDRVALGSSTLEAGRTYHLVIETAMTSDVVQVLKGMIIVRYDNVKLTG